MAIHARQGRDHAAVAARRPIMIYAKHGIHQHWRDLSKADLTGQAKRGANRHHRPYVFSNNGCDI
jgi:hypothetical protein